MTRAEICHKCINAWALTHYWTADEIMKYSSSLAETIDKGCCIFSGAKQPTEKCSYRLELLMLEQS